MDVSAILRRFLLAVLACLPGTVLAAGFNPQSLQTVLGVNVAGFHAQADAFAQASEHLGPALQVNEGDAASYEGSVSYVDAGAVRALRFIRTECTDEWELGPARDVARRNPGEIKQDLSSAGSAGVHLGAPAAAVSKLLDGHLAGQWKLASRKRSQGTWEWDFEKTLRGRDGGPSFCNHIWVTLRMEAGKVAYIRIASGGCDDSACGRPG